MTVREIMDQLKDCADPENTHVCLCMNPQHNTLYYAGRSAVTKEKLYAKGWVYEIDKIQKYENNPLYLEIEFTDYGEKMDYEFFIRHSTPEFTDDGKVRFSLSEYREIKLSKEEYYRIMEDK